MVLGYATAIGLHIDIPKLIRLLAERLFLDNIDFLSYLLGAGISTELDLLCEEKISDTHNWWDKRIVRQICYDSKM